MATLYYESQYFTTTLSVAGGINDSVTTGIVLQAITGIHDTSKPGIALLSYADPLDTSVAEWVTFTSINSTTKTLVGVTRGAEGFSAKAHGNGVTVAFPHSKSHINNIVNKLNGTDSLENTILVYPVVKTAYNNGNLGATPTINWANGDLQTGTLSENCTYDFSNAVAGQRLTFFALENGTGTYTQAFTPTIIWQDATTPSWTTTANKMNVFVIYYDGSNYYGMGAKFAA